MKYKGFTEVELRRPTRSTFDLSQEIRTSTRIGKLTPILIHETMPNDTFYGSTEVLCKMAPMLAPIFHRLNLYVHFFFVPNRLIWKDWETFITGGRLGEAVNDPPQPPWCSMEDLTNKVFNGVNWLSKGSVMDYLGVPPVPDYETGDWGPAQGLHLMPAAAWYKVYMDYYRDRNYYADNDYLPLQSGQYGNAEGNMPAVGAMLETRYRAWQREYYTSALPWTQRGAEVLMPLQGSGLVTYKDADDVVLYDGLGNPILGAGDVENAGAGTMRVADGVTNPFAQLRNIEEVELTSSDVSINDLRRAVKLQEWLERNALAGSRYNESILAHFGRKTSDQRLQRAEYIGGGKAVLNISEVLTTAYSEDAEAAIVPPGNMAGRGSAYANTNAFSYNCEEHGFVIGIMSCMPTTAYYQGIPRMFFTRRSFLDYPFPTFAHLGEQEVWKTELWLDKDTLPDAYGEFAADGELFSYQSRYSDWKFAHNTVHGDFRDTLEFWHMARKFSAPPSQGYDFGTFEDALQDRVFAVAETDTMWCYIYNSVRVKRSLPYFGTPML